MNDKVADKVADKGRDKVGEGIRLEAHGAFQGDGEFAGVGKVGGIGRGGARDDVGAKIVGHGVQLFFEIESDTGIGIGSGAGMNGPTLEDKFADLAFLGCSRAITATTFAHGGGGRGRGAVGACSRSGVGNPRTTRDGGHMAENGDEFLDPDTGVGAKGILLTIFDGHKGRAQLGEQVGPEETVLHPANDLGGFIGGGG